MNEKEYVKIIESKDQYYPLYKIFFDFDIESPILYADVIKILEEADEKTKIELYLNSYGGYIDTAIQIADAVENCKGETESIIYTACSAASIIALSAKKINLRPLCKMMIHPIQIKQDFLDDTIRHVRYANAYNEWEKKVFQKYFKGFLTEEEISKVVEQRYEIWLFYEDIKERIRKMRRENDE